MILSNVRYIYNRKCNFFYFYRLIGTSVNDTQSSFTLNNAPKAEVKRVRRNLNWRSYGYDFIDQRNDIFWMHATSFGLVTVFFWGTILCFYYYPDMSDMDWIHREAYIQLRRREVLGLPAVDKNYVDPATIVLPPDEELGDDEIII